MSNQFKILKFGFINYFGYKSQEIKLDDGIAVIQGSNGTGKTVTVSSLLPSLLTLDLKRSLNMNKSTRKGRDPETFVGNTESPSYIWIEIGNEEYKKTIAGIYRRKGTTGIDQKGIIFKDNVSIDERIFSSINGEIYNYKQFKDFNQDIIEGIYEVSDRLSYMERINELFYGFKDLDDYNRNIDIIYNLENATQGNETIDLKYIEENLKSILPDYDQDTNGQIVGFIETVKKNKEAKEKKEAYEKSAEILANINNLVNSYNYNHIKEIKRSSKNLDDKLNDLKDNLERLNIQKDNKEKLLNEIITKNKNIELRQSEINNEISLINVDDIENIKFFLNETNKDIEKLNNTLKSYEREKTNLDKSISEKEALINRYKEEIEDINLFLLDNSDKVELLENKNIFKDIDEQIKYIRDIEVIKKDNQKNIYRLDDIKRTLSINKEELKEIEDSIIKEKELLETSFIDWLEKLTINIPSDFSLDSFLENNFFNEEINEQRNNIEKDIRNLELSLKNLYDEKIDFEKILKELEDNAKPKSYSKHKGGYELYECISFKDNILNEDRIKIESSLKESNLLFTIFKPKELEYGYKYINHTSILNTSNRLVSYFNISEEVPNNIKNDIVEFLNNIYINENKNVVYNNIEIIPNEIKNSIEYIGALEREKKRLQDIYEINNKINDIKEHIDEEESRLGRVKNTLKKFDNTINNKPNLDKLKTLEYEYSRINESIDKDNIKLEELNKNLSNYHTSIEDINNKMYEHLSKEYDTINNLKFELINIKNENKSLISKKEYLDNLEKELDANIKNRNTINENIELDNIELNKLTDLKKQYEDKIGSKDVKDKLERINILNKENKTLKKELTSNTKEEGKLENNLENIIEKLEKTDKSLNSLIEEKETKDLLIEDHRINDFIKPDKIFSINKFDSDLNRYTIEFDNQAYNNYKVSVNRNNDFKIDTDTRSIELAEIENAFKQLKEINFMKNEEVYSMEEVEKEFIQELKIYQKLVEENSIKQLELFSGTTIIEPINRTVDKAFEIAKEIQDEMNGKKQEDYMSFFIEYRIKESATTFQKAFFKKNSNKLDKEYKEKLTYFVEDLSSKIEKSIDDGMDRESIENFIFDELNYKNIIDVKIYHKLNKNAEKKLLNAKAMANISEGQRKRAMLEPMFIVLKKNLDKAELKEKAFSILLLDEGFNKMDYEQQQLLEETIYENFGSVLIASSTTTLFGPKNGSKIINYIFLNKIVSKDGSEVIYVDEPKSVVVSYD